MKSLNKKHLKAIECLLRGDSQGAAAKAAGCSLTSLKSWLKKPLFKAELERLEGAEKVAVAGELGKAVEFQAQVRERTRQLYFSILDRIEPAIEDLEDIGLSRNLPPLVKAIRDATELALTVDNETLGLEELAKDVDALSKAQK